MNKQKSFSRKKLIDLLELLLFLSMGVIVIIVLISIIT